MRLCQPWLWVAACAAVSPGAFAGVEGQNDEVQQLKQQVADLQAQVQSLQQSGSEAWLTEQRAEQIRGVVQDVLADADTRTSLLQGGMTAGYDGGAVIASGDGNFKLKLKIHEQVRFVFNRQDDDDNPAIDSTRWGIENRRFKIILAGNVVDPTWTYEMQFNADRNSGVMALEDAGWIGKDLGNGWLIRFGQMKAPFMREEIVSSQRFFMIERSLLNDEFTARTVQGVRVSYSADKYRVYGMFHDGSVNGVNSGSANTGWSAEDTEYAFSARGEFMLKGGNWSQFDDYSGFRGDETAVLLGAAVNYQNQEYGTGNNLLPPDFNNNEINNFGFTADVSVEGSGWNVHGAFVYRMLDPQAGSSLDQFGLMIRGGYFITDTVELYAGYEWGDFDVPGIDDLSILTIGATKYFAGHNLKWQNDIGFGLDEVNAVWANDGAGWRADADDADAQIVIRSQFQLVY